MAGMRKSKLYRAVLDELQYLETLAWFTPYLGRRKSLLEKLKRHLEEEEPQGEERRGKTRKRGRAFLFRIAEGTKEG
jgi:hypothetical protein